MSNLAQIVSRITTRFPRASEEFTPIITSDMSKWIEALSTTFPWWFLNMAPGQAVLDRTTPLNFTTLPTVGPTGSQWVDVGWLLTVPGQSTYDFYHPLTEEGYQAAPDQEDLRQPCKVQRVDYCLEFNNKLEFVQNVPVLEHGEAFNFASFKEHGRPCQIVWRKLETKSQLIVQPVPDEAYLLAIQFSISNPPIYSFDGEDFLNRWFTFAPEAMELYGLIKAAEFFGEAKKKELYMIDLYGNPPTGDYGTRQTFIGELGRLKKETVAKQHRLQERMQFFMSQRAAFGSSQGANYPSETSVLRFRYPQYRTSRYW